MVERLDTVPPLAQPDGLESLLDAAVAACDRGAGNDDLGPELIERRALGVDVPDLRDLVAIARLRIDDLVRHGEQGAVVTVEEPLLVRERNAAHVAVELQHGVP